MTIKETDVEAIKAILIQNRIESPTGCWLWSKCENEDYGTLNAFGKIMSVHRLAYELWMGPIPLGLVLMHSCDTPRCFNPSHLKPGTQRENRLDCVAKGRHYKTKKRTVEAARLTITVPKPLVAELRRLVDDGLHGNSIAEVAERLVSEKIRQLLKEGTIQKQKKAFTEE